MLSWIHRLLEIGVAGVAASRHHGNQAEERRRRWPSPTALAIELGIGVSTVRVVDPGRLLMLWAGHRRLHADVDERFTIADYETVIIYGDPQIRRRRRVPDPHPGRVCEVIPCLVDVMTLASGNRPINRRTPRLPSERTCRRARTRRAP